ncbi:MAG TPA: (2Fe-2S)-binding protein [Myxococcales bacterium]|nr:(2Fe-2S)-binding protein [Myxococcales bacterium]
MAYSLVVNGRSVRLDLPGDTPLLWALREGVGLTGTKFGCGRGLCGACTVHVNGEPVRSCSVALESVAGAKVTTVEGLSSLGKRLQEAWIAEQVPQCGYCQSGMLMSAAALLSANPKPTEEDVRNAMTNLCRCGTYARVRRAILRVVEAT